MRLAGAAESVFVPSMLAVEEAIVERGPGAHSLTGPIFVEGAEVGDVVEVRLLDIQPLLLVGVFGFLPAGGTLPDDCPFAGRRLFEIDRVAQVARMANGLGVPLRPFFGSMGVAPPVLRGRVSSGAPGFRVGNLDNKELQEPNPGFPR